MRKLLILSALLVLTFNFFGQTEPFCNHEQMLDEVYFNDSLKETYHREMLDLSERAREVRDYQNDPLRGGGPTQVLNESCFVIPVVVHVIHQGETYPAGSNIPDEQVLSAINRMNQSFSGIPTGIDTKIRFCLAEMENGNIVNWSNPETPGVLRYENPFDANHELTSDEISNIVFNGVGGTFSSDRYANIVVVNNFFAFGALMQTTNGNSNFFSPLLDNRFITIRNSVFGHEDDSVNAPIPFDLIPGYERNTIIVHEMGHFFGLSHTFNNSSFCDELGMYDHTCDSEGDYVCDTPPSRLPYVQFQQCQNGPNIVNTEDLGNTCHEIVNYGNLLGELTDGLIPFPNPNTPLEEAIDLYDLNNNYMAYTNPECINSFTYGQVFRMQAKILQSFPLMSSLENLLNTLNTSNGCVFPTLSTDLVINAFDACSGELSVSAPEANPWNLNYHNNWQIFYNEELIYSENSDDLSIILNNPGIYELIFTTSTEDNESTITVHRSFHVSNCQEYCSLICNGGFEYNNGNLLINGMADDSAGQIINDCLTNEEVIPCWKSHELTNIIEYERLPYSVIFGADFVSNWIQPSNLYSFQVPYEVSGDFHFARLSKYSNLNQDVNGGLVNRFISPTLADLRYVLKYKWAYQSNMQSDLMDVRVGIGNDECNGLENGPFPVSVVDFSFSPWIYEEEEWYLRVEEFTFENLEFLQFSLADNTIDNSNYFFNLYLDDVHLISENNDPVSILLEELNTIGCGERNMKILISPDIIADDIYTDELDFTVQLYAYEGADLIEITEQVIFNDLGEDNNFSIPANYMSLGSEYINEFSLDLSQLPYPRMFCTVSPVNENCCIGTQPWIKIHNVNDSQRIYVDHVSCPGANDGMISILENSGGNVYWESDAGTSGILDNSLSNLGPGVFHISWEDENSCLWEYDVEIVEPNSPITISADLQNPNCLGGFGQIDLNVSGAWGDYLYEWKKTPNVFVSNEEDLLNVSASTYRVVVNSAPNGGNGVVEEDVDGDGDLEVVNGHLIPIYYHNPGCEAQASFVISDGIDLIPDMVLTSPNCNPITAGQLYLENLDPEWSVSLYFENQIIPQTSFGLWDNLILGDYRLSITTSENCYFEHYFSMIDENNCCEIEDLDFSYTLNEGACEVLDGELDVSFEVTGGIGETTLLVYIGNIPFGAENIESITLNYLPGDVYQIFIQDEIGCTYHDAISLPYPYTLGLVYSNIINASCEETNNGSISVFPYTLTPGSTTILEWFDSENEVIAGNQNNVDGLAPGQYWLTVSDSQTGCINTYYYNIEIQSGGQIAASAITCSPSNTIDLSVSGGSGFYEYSWMNDENVVISNQEDLVTNDFGTYTVTISDASECNYSSLDYSIDFTPYATNASLLLDVIEPCLDEGLGSVDLTVVSPPNNGEESFKWTKSGYIYGQSEDISGLTSGNYTITYVNSDLGCLIGNVELELEDEPEISTSVVQPDCENNTLGSIQVEIELEPGDLLTDFIIKWSYDGSIIGNESSISNLNPGFYSVAVSGDNNCVVTETVQINENSWDYPSDISIALVGNGTDVISTGDALAWNGSTVSFGGNLTILADVDLELIGTQFYFNNNSELLIEEDASFECTDCIFDACAGMWEGIVLKSDPVQVGFPAYIALDGCQISNAVLGIKATVDNWQGVYTNSNINSWRSGRINADNTLFYNNQRSVHLSRSSYMNNSLVGFENCQFEIDDQNRFNTNSDHNDEVYFPVNPSAYPFGSHVYYQYVRGHHFKNCVFKNHTDVDIDEWTDRGVGIRAVNANFTIDNSGIDDPLNPFADAHFQGFNKGVSAWVSKSQWNGMRIFNTSFDKNKVGIYTDNLSFHTLVDNYFRVGEATGHSELDLYDDYEGIAVLGGAGFKIAQNTLEGGSGLDSDTRTFGIRVRDTKTNDDEVYKNSFNNLGYANLANGENIPPGGNAAVGGLRYVCNENTNNDFDFTVSDFNIGGAPEVLAIAQNQNATGEDVFLFENVPSAGNTFTTNPSENYGHFRNEGEFIYYLPYFELSYSPLSFTSGTITNLSYSNLLSCAPYLPIIDPNGIKDIPKYSERLVKSQTAFAEWQNTKFLWLSIIDEGDTPSLKQEVVNAWTENTWTVRDKLLNLSPNVSKDVLYEVANKTATYPHPIAFEIFVANPHVLKDTKFLDYLESKADPMPSYMVDLLYSARAIKTFRTDLEREINQFRAMYLQNSYELIRADLYNDADWDAAVLRAAELDNFAVQLNNSISLMEQGNSGQDILLDLSDYAEDFNLSDEHNQLEEFLLLKHQVDQSNRDWDALTPLEISNLEDIADHFRTLAGRMSMEILNNWYGGTWFIPPAVGGNWTPRALSMTALSSGFIEDEIKVYPNPANTICTVELNLNSSEDGTFVVLDAQSRVIHTQQIKQAVQLFSINTSNWAAGQYQWVIKSSKLYKTGKLQIEH